MNKQIEALTNMGLSQKEASVYLALLELGKGSAYAIAEKSKIKRPTTYVLLDELIKKDLVLKIPRAKKQIFIAKSPEIFFREQERKILSSKSVLPELLALTSNENRKMKVTYYEGLRGIKEAVDYGTNKDKPSEILGFFATAEHISDDLMEVMDHWSKTMLEKNISMRGFTPDHPSTRKMLEKDLSDGFNLRTIPYNKYSSTISIDASDDFMRIIMNRDLQAVIIENKEVAKTLKQIVNLLWDK